MLSVAVAIIVVIYIGIITHITLLYYYPCGMTFTKENYRPYHK